MNAAPWVVDLPSVASSSTTFHLLHSPFSSTPLYAFLSSPLLSSPLRLLSARFLHAPRFFSYFPRVSLLSLLSRGVGRPRPLPAFFPLRLDPPLLRPATSYSAFFRFSPISAILVFSADRSARSFASRKFRSETNDDFKIEANRAPSSFRIGQENAFLSSPVSVRRGRCVHHPSRKSDSSANRSRFRSFATIFDPLMGSNGGPRISFESLSSKMGSRSKNCQRAFLISSCSRYALLLLSSVSASLSLSLSLSTPPFSSFSSSSSPSGTSYLLHRFLVQGVAQTQYVFAMRARYYDVRCIHVIVRVRDA